MAEELPDRQINEVFENMLVGRKATIYGICGNVAVGYTPSSGLYYAYRTYGVRELPESVVVEKVLLPDGPGSSIRNPFFVVDVLPVRHDEPYTIKAVYAVVPGTVIEPI